MEPQGTGAGTPPAGDPQASNGTGTETLEQMKARIAQLEKERSDANREAAERRVKLNEYEEQKRKEQEAKLLEEKKYQELLAAKEQEIADYKNKTAELDTLAARLKAIEEARRAELITRLPEAVRAKEIYKTLTLDALEAVVSDFAAKPSGASPGVNDGGTPPNGDTPTTLKGMSQEQQAQLQKTNPDLFQKLLKQMFAPAP